MILKYLLSTYFLPYQYKQKNGSSGKNSKYKIDLSDTVSLLLLIASFINTLILDSTVYCIIVIRNWKIVWKHGLYCLYFCWNLKYFGWPYREYIKTAKNASFCEELLSENDFEAVLATFCCYDYGVNTSEALQKKKIKKKCSSCVIVSWIAKMDQPITVKKGWLLGHLRRT